MNMHQRQLKDALHMYRVIYLCMYTDLNFSTPKHTLCGLLAQRVFRATYLGLEITYVIYTQFINIWVYMYNGYLKYMQSVHVLYIIMTNIHLPIGARLQSCMCILYIKIQPIEKIINRAFISLDLIYKEQNSYTELPQILCNVQNYNFLISKKMIARLSYYNFSPQICQFYFMKTVKLLICTQKFLVTYTDCKSHIQDNKDM